MSRRNNSLHRNGYMRVTPMAGFGKAEEPPINKRTPFELTTNELAKKLCSKGPKGCNESCENWRVCLYGRAWRERQMQLTVKANITLNNGERIVRYFADMAEASEWADRHTGHYKKFAADEMKPEKEGKDNG